MMLVDQKPQIGTEINILELLLRIGMKEDKHKSCFPGKLNLFVNLPLTVWLAAFILEM